MSANGFSAAILGMRSRKISAVFVRPSKREVFKFDWLTVRVACPPGLLPNVLTPILPGFVAAYPEVRLALAVSNRRVDLVEDGFDVAIRVRERLDTDQDLVLRRLGVSRRILVADPTHLSRRAPVRALADLPN
jgi:DNA-binding transcriptional LysR family regulator